MLRRFGIGALFIVGTIGTVATSQPPDPPPPSLCVDDTSRDEDAIACESLCESAVQLVLQTPSPPSPRGICRAGVDVDGDDVPDDVCSCVDEGGTQALVFAGIGCAVPRTARWLPLRRRRIRRLRRQRGLRRRLRDDP